MPRSISVKIDRSTAFRHDNQEPPPGDLHAQASTKPARRAPSRSHSPHPATAAAQFSNVYFFGDSLTDAGSYKPVLPPGTGLFTTNPGPVWAQVFGATLRLRRDARESGRHRLRARRRARHAACRASRRSPPTGSAVPIATQITQFLRIGPARSEGALCRMGRRATTSSFSSASRGAGAATPAQVQAAVGLAAVQLAAAGRRPASRRRAVHHRSSTCPTSARRPRAVASGQAASISALSSLFNTTLIRRARRRAASATMRVNTFALLQRNPGEPGRFRIREHDHACVRPHAVAPLHVRELRHAERGADVPLRRRRASDDRGTRDHRADSCNR